MNHVYKLTPVSMYDVRGLEQWLETMAAQGLFLKKYGPLVCRFTKGEAKTVRYRLEPYRITLSGGFPNDMVELFQECGWEHVGTIHAEMLIFSAADPHAPEPHTDLDIQLEQWNKLYKAARKDFIGIGLFTLACFALIAWFIFSHRTPLSDLLVSSFALVYPLAFLVIRPTFELGAYYSKVRELAAVIRELEGAPKKRRLWFPSRQFFSWIATLALIFLLALLLYLLGNPLREPGAKPVTDFIPLTLTALETGQPVEDRPYYGTPQYSLLCRRQWRVLDLSDGTYVNIQWFDLHDWLSFLAVPAARDLMEDAMKLDDLFWESDDPAAWVTREHPEAGADWLSIAVTEDGAYQAAVAALGDKVVRIQYTGSGKLADRMDEIVAMVR